MAQVLEEQQSSFSKQEPKQVRQEKLLSEIITDYCIPNFEKIEYKLCHRLDGWKDGQRNIITNERCILGAVMSYLGWEGNSVIVDYHSSASCYQRATAMFHNVEQAMGWHWQKGSRNTKTGNTRYNPGAVIIDMNNRCKYNNWHIIAALCQKAERKMGLL
jgi:hypothetical protein